MDHLVKVGALRLVLAEGGNGAIRAVGGAAEGDARAADGALARLERGVGREDSRGRDGVDCGQDDGADGGDLQVGGQHHDVVFSSFSTRTPDMVSLDDDCSGGALRAKDDGQDRLLDLSLLECWACLFMPGRKEEDASSVT